MDLRPGPGTPVSSAPPRGRASRASCASCASRASCASCASCASRASWRSGASRRRHGGFTLLETLAALVIVGVTAAVVIPEVIQQIERAQPVRVARDLRRLHTALDAFSATHFPAMPGDLEDLANLPDGDDLQAAGTPYAARDLARWIGPYVDTPLVGGGVETGAAIQTGYDGEIQQALVCYDAELDESVTCQMRPGVFLAIQVENLLGDEFARVNDLVDGESESDELILLWGGSTTESRITGRLRYSEENVVVIGIASGTMYYLVAPYRDR